MLARPPSVNSFYLNCCGENFHWTRSKALKKNKNKTTEKEVDRTCLSQFFFFWKTAVWLSMLGLKALIVCERSTGYQHVVPVTTARLNVSLFFSVLFLSLSLTSSESQQLCLGASDIFVRQLLTTKRDRLFQRPTLLKTRVSPPSILKTGKEVKSRKGCPRAGT